MNLFSVLGLGSGKIKKALRRGAIIVDVRTPQEYDRGHIPDAFNIPVDRLKASVTRLKAAKMPIVLCCSNGERCSVALQQLKAGGLKDVYNGGSWQNVLKILSRI